MAVKISFQDKGLKAGIVKLKKAVSSQNVLALTDIANEVLRLSSFEVPHDKGLLQASGNVQRSLVDPETMLVGYNKVYASRLHEHPEYHFQKGRKGKYLEDPIKNNLRTLRQFYRDSIKKIFK